MNDNNLCDVLDKVSEYVNLGGGTDSPCELKFSREKVSVEGPKGCSIL